MTTLIIKIFNFSKVNSLILLISILIWQMQELHLYFIFVAFIFRDLILINAIEYL